MENKQAVRWYRKWYKIITKQLLKGTAWPMIKAAELGDADAQYNLGKAYQDEHDYTKAVHWFKLSAAQNHKIALSDLAYYYLNGKGGCNKKFSKAIYLYKKAAERNYYHFKNN
jgi:TPR repeat protein